MIAATGVRLEAAATRLDRYPEVRDQVDEQLRQIEALAVW
jgi:hypothetical protein